MPAFPVAHFLTSTLIFIILLYYANNMLLDLEMVMVLKNAMGWTAADNMVC